MITFKSSHRSLPTRSGQARFCLTRAALGALFIALLAAAPAYAAPAWLSPVDLSVAGQTTFQPQIAVDGAGDAVAVWTRFDGNTIIQSATRPAGGAFSAPVDLSAAGQNAFGPQIAVDGAGDAVAVWVRSNGIIQSATRPAGGAFSAPTDLSAAGQIASMPQIAIDGAGDAVAVWERSNGTNEIIQSATRSLGGSFSAPVDLSAVGQNATEPQIAVDGAGDAVAVWQRSNGTNEIIQSATRPAGGAFSAPIDLSVAGQSADLPQIAVDGAGDAVAVWDRSNGTNQIAQSSTRPAGGAFSAPVDLSAAGQSASVSQIAIDGVGDAVAVWTRFDGTNTIIQSATRPAGGAFSAPVDLSAPGASRSQIAIDGAGDAVAVWTFFDGTSEVIQSATRPAGGAFSAPINLSAAGRQIHSVSQIAVDGAGDAVAVWERSNGTNTIIQAAGYDGDGPQLRSLAIPTTGRAGEPISFSVSPFDVWSGPGPTAWSFGDGGKATTNQATHVYARPGIYPVSLTATDALGNPSTSAATIAISPGAGTALGSHLAKVKKGKALLRLSCQEIGPCRGVATLTYKPKAKAKIVLGKHSFQIAAGASRTVAVKLSAKVRRLVADAGHKGLVATLGGSGVKPGAVRLKG